MAMTSLEEVARAIVADGKGILAADESLRTITKRFAARAIESSAGSRRAYREMLFSTPDIAPFISATIMFDETIRQKSSMGVPLIYLLTAQGIVPGIKVDEGTHPLAGAPGELITEGLDGLRERLDEYRQLGARFAKWRAAIAIGSGLPTARCVKANAHALARYAALCQERGLMPIVEPEVLMDGDHTLERCEEVTGQVLHAVFDALFEEKVSLEEMLLKPNMVIAGEDCPKQGSVQEVAAITVRTLTRHVPPAVPGVVFLSGGQDPVSATKHLNAMNLLEGSKPYKLTFSYGRALQDEALAIWNGRSDNLVAGQRAFHHRARCDSAASLGRYHSVMENDPAFA